MPRLPHVRPLLALLLLAPVPRAQEVEVLEATWSSEELAAARASAGADTWAEGDVLTLCFEHERTEGVLALVAGNLEPMQRIGDTWVVRARIEGLDSMVLSYGFYAREGPVNLNLSGWGELSFRGPEAPPEPPRSKPLQGEVLEFPFESVVLEEAREVFLYLPPGHDPEKTYPVIYMTDGAGSGYAQFLEGQILEEAVPPTILVGLPPGRGLGNGEPGNDQRAREYLLGADEAAYDLHEEFFVFEVRTLIEDRYGAARERELRIVSGCSNGASFALSAARRNPHVYGHVIALSFGWQPELERWRKADLSGDVPDIHLAAGVLEPGFLRVSKGLHSLLESRALPNRFTERNSGHDVAMWHEEFAHAAALALSR